MDGCWLPMMDKPRPHPLAGHQVTGICCWTSSPTFGSPGNLVTRLRSSQHATARNSETISSEQVISIGRALYGFIIFISCGDKPDKPISNLGQTPRIQNDDVGRLMVFCLGNSGLQRNSAESLSMSQSSFYKTKQCPVDGQFAQTTKRTVNSSDEILTSSFCSSLLSQSQRPAINCCRCSNPHMPHAHTQETSQDCV